MSYSKTYSLFFLTLTLPNVQHKFSDHNIGRIAYAQTIGAMSRLD